MQKITVYDIEAEQLEKIADDNDTNVAEIVEMLFEYVEDMKRDNNLKQNNYLMEVFKMSKQEKYTEIKERLLKKEAMQTLYNSNCIIFHNLVISIMENESK